MAEETDDADRKGLIRESYRIEGITPEECRSILVDWALSVPLDADHPGLIATLLERYGADKPDHPMTAVLREGMTPAKRQGRRGGRAARVG